MLTETERKLFQEWSHAKRLIAIAVRVRVAGFFKEMRDFSKPEDTSLVLYCNSASKEFFTPRLKEVFDLKTQTPLEDCKSTDDIIIPELIELAKELKEVVDLRKLEIHYTCDQGMASVCRFRKLIGLPGPYLSDLSFLCHKDKVFARAAEHAIPTAKYVAVDFKRMNLEKVAQKADLIEKELGPYPLFKRPQCLFGTLGATPVGSRKELVDWMKGSIRADDISTHLIEEYIVGREFLAVGLVTHNGTYCPLVVKYLEFGWSKALYVATGRPVAVFVDTFREVEYEEFPGLGNFVDKVVKAFKPPSSQMFSIQGFQLSPIKSGDYILVELTPRISVPETGSIIYQVSGVDQDAASLTSMVDIDYRPKVDLRRGRQKKVMLWFPQVKGTFKEYTKLPGKEVVKSVIEENWLYPLGTTFKAAADVTSHMLTLTLQNSNREQLLEDAKWIANNWRPKLEKNIE